MSAVILRGDARELPLPDESVDLIVTSPPYFGLRSYTDGGEHYAGQIGSEATPREYVAALLDCTREWIRVLKPSGSIFVVLGDKYSGAQQQNSGRQSTETSSDYWRRTDPKRTGIPNKSLMGLPWRYALGCVDDLSLILRAEVIWAKPNGLPESVTDRARRSHEQMFHLAKQPRYFSAVDEIREGYAPGTAERYRSGYGPNQRAANGAMRGSAGTIFNGETFGTNPLGKLPGSVWEIATTPLFVPDHLGVGHFAAFPLELPRRIILGWSPTGTCLECGQGRFPVTQATRVELRHRDLPGRARLNRDTVHGMDQRAGTHVLNRTAITGYACPCTPFTDHPERRGKDFHRQDVRGERGANDGNGGERFRRYVEDLASPRGPVREYDFDAWTPAPTRPAVVLDPFGGTGTTALAADVLGRTGISVDRSADYCRLATWRTTDPGERARAMQVPKPPPVPEGQGSLFDAGEATA